MEGGFTLPKVYRTFAWSFFGSALLLLIFLVYVIWARVTIVITPTAQPVSQEFVVTVTEGSAEGGSGNTINGRVRSVEASTTEQFIASGQQPVVTDVVGEVTIVNSYSQEQTLVEKTRLATAEDPETILVRLKRTVVVAPGEQVTVPVYPENPETFKKIEPRRLIIPGLWGPLREKIYAENAKPLSREGQTVTVVTPEDLAQAETKLQEKLKSQAISQVNSGLAAPEAFWPKLVAVDQREVRFDVEAGDEAATFTGNGTLRAVVVAFDEGRIAELAGRQLQASLGDQRQLIEVDQASLSYSIEHFDLGSRTATVRVSVGGSSALAAANSALSKGKLTGKTADEIKQYFSQFAEIKSVEVIFSPPWLRKTPRLEDKIEITIHPAP